MTSCQFCSETHGVRCPSVKAIEYHTSGKVKRVEFMTPKDYHPMPLTGIVQPGIYPYPATVWSSQGQNTQ